jgi:hypothetical protein
VLRYESAIGYELSSDRVLAWLERFNRHMPRHACTIPGNTDLGTACGRYFRVSVLAITDPGDSDIIKAVPSE